MVQGESSAFTRRSAGLPSILAGILKADTDGNIFRSAMSTLERLAAREVYQHAGQEVPRVHAMNCSKDLFLDSQLSQQLQCHVSQFLSLAADALESSQ